MQSKPAFILPAPLYFFKPLTHPDGNKSVLAWVYIIRHPIQNSTIFDVNIYIVCFLLDPLNCLYWRINTPDSQNQYPNLYWTFVCFCSRHLRRGKEAVRRDKISIKLSEIKYFDTILRCYFYSRHYYLSADLWMSCTIYRLFFDKNLFWQECIRFGKFTSVGKYEKCKSV